jgi:hypothetical protein
VNTGRTTHDIDATLLAAKIALDSSGGTEDAIGLIVAINGNTVPNTAC